MTSANWTLDSIALAAACILLILAPVNAVTVDLENDPLHKEKTRWAIIFLVEIALFILVWILLVIEFVNLPFPNALSVGMYSNSILIAAFAVGCVASVLCCVDGFGFVCRAKEC